MAAKTKECKTLKTAEPLDDLLFFKTLRPQTMAFLKKEGRTQNWSKGQIIFMHEDEASCFYFLENGWIKLFRETLDGDEAILDVLPPGAVFGEIACLENGIYSSGAEALENCRTVSFPLSTLQKEIEESNTFAISFLRHLAEKNLKKDKEIELRSVQNAAQRIGCFLLRLCKTAESNTQILHLSWEKSLIAARLGMAPETFSRSLAKLQKDVNLRIKGSTIEIPDIGALVRYTCTACSNVFPCDH
ncbi:MAG: Crp/Fnr family transcriptional regulator [Alphaproteobacteria bacterium]|nr:Crp/Fnr family transcriptional regulator [Alphaproteobacteria bacterium]